MLPLRLLTGVFNHSGRSESTIVVVTQASVSQPYAHVRREISYLSPRKFRLETIGPDGFTGRSQTRSHFHCDLDRWHFRPVELPRSTTPQPIHRLEAIGKGPAGLRSCRLQRMVMRARSGSGVPACRDQAWRAAARARALP